MAADYPTSVYAADLDNDGDMDILSASSGDDKIAWYENEGSGNFSNQQIITTAANGASSVYAADLDNDGDTDVLSASVNDDKIAWYENDGSGNFGTQQIITTDTNHATSVYAADLDNDGDMDVLSASRYDYNIAWYENDESGNFGNQQIITTDAIEAQSVYAADLDNDGDMDVLSASSSKISWYENDGSGNFGTQQIITTATDGAYAADLDNDGDMDVLSTSFDDSKIAWYENDGSGNFGNQQIITTNVDGATSVYAADLDNDGDMDVLSASCCNSDKIAWYENEGSGNFGTQQIITTDVHVAVCVYAADLDNDGDIDVLSASQYAGKIAWYENLLNNPHISGTVFYDTNQNGVLDAGEYGLSSQGTAINPGTTYSYANANGVFAYYTETAGTYTLSYTVPNNWAATTPTSQTITTDEDGYSSNNNFGIYPNTLNPDIEPYLIADINRCNWTVPYYLTVINEGTTIEPLSIVSLQPDEQLTYISATPEPDSISTQGKIYWHTNNLLPTQQSHFTVQFHIPDFNSMGDTLSTLASVTSFNTNGEQTDQNAFGYRTVVVCSYDPNDKQVYPAGIGEQHYTLINNDELIYTIRFQNTGNDTAFNIIIADTLSNYLDRSTFRPITSSHPMQVVRNESGLVEFKFNHILLPDSTTNEPRSHGYLMYGIKAQTPVPDNTLIANTAHIYFDFNPAIVTNTTQSLMVYNLPTGIGITVNDGTVVSNKISAFVPNPSTQQSQLNYNLNNQEIATLSIYDYTGRKIEQTHLTGTGTYQFNTANYPVGMYVYAATIDGSIVLQDKLVIVK